MKIYFSRWTGEYNNVDELKIKDKIIERFKVDEGDIIDPSSIPYKSHSMSNYIL